MSDTHIDSDADSLFGSPPPSPVQSEGRFASLALPCGPHGSAAHENVGTIALPGSHNRSEPVINLPVSPPRRHANAVASERASTSRVPADSSLQVNETQRPGLFRNKKSKAATRNASVVEPPSFVLPDVGSPTPVHLFRNQQALLGHAGVVAGLKPTSLPPLGHAGTTQYNPIIVDDETQSSLHSWRASSRLRQSSQSHTPSTPVEETNPSTSMHELLSAHGAGVDVGCCAGNHALQALALQTVSQRILDPPAKRRRLNDSQVKQTAKERGRKQLESGLHGNTEGKKKGKGRNKKMLLHVLSMLKEALEKSGSHAGLEGSTDENAEIVGGASRYYRPETAHYGIDLLATELQNTSSPFDSSFSSDQALSIPPNDPLTAAWDQLAVSDDYSYDSSAQSASPLLDSLTTQLEQNDFESWLSIVNNHLGTSLPEESRSEDVMSMLDSALSSTSSPVVSSTRFPTPADIASTTVGSEESEASVLAGTGLDTNVPPLGPDVPIDPLLLALSSTVPQLCQSTGLVDRALEAQSLLEGVGNTFSRTVHQASRTSDSTKFSPAKDDVNSTACATSPQTTYPSIPAVSSTSATTTIDVDTSSCSSGSVFPAEVKELEQVGEPSKSGPASQHDRDSRQGVHSDSPSCWTGEAQVMNPLSMPLASVPIASQAAMNGTWTAYDSSYFNTYIPSRAVSSAASTVPPKPHKGSEKNRVIDKQVSLKTAKHRREQLATELARAKIELWETTIEQGVLLNLLKDKDLDS